MFSSKIKLFEHFSDESRLKSENNDKIQRKNNIIKSRIDQNRITDFKTKH